MTNLEQQSKLARMTHTATLQFYHRGQTVRLQNVAPTRTILQYLREDQHCTGTKEGCAEGDCGACTVVIGAAVYPKDQTGQTAKARLQLRSVNACIQFLPTLHGKALFTVEDLKALNAGQLHPVQQAMVNCHGAQCGFCTPGIVMSLWDQYEWARDQAQAPLSREALAEALSGNLCRCTGYRPILDAGEQMFDLPAAPLDRAPILAALSAIHDDPQGRQGLVLQHPTGRYYAPRHIDDFAECLRVHPDAHILAGSTDMGLWVNKQFKPLTDLVYAGDVAALKSLTQSKTHLHIGAAVALEDAWEALVHHYPNLQEVWKRFASPPVRHAGTMGGNVANGSPIGDSSPVLMALDAHIVLQQGQQQRQLPLRRFYLDYMKKDLRPGEFLREIVVPLPRPRQSVAVYKISKRHDCDISAVCAAFSVELDEQQGVKDIRLVFGGMAATVKHAQQAEACLQGQAFDEVHVKAAMQALTQDYQPLSDMRASSAYRMQVAQNLLYKFFLQNTLPSAAAASDAGLSVWSAHV